MRIPYLIVQSSTESLFMQAVIAACDDDFRQNDAPFRQNEKQRYVLQ